MLNRIFLKKTNNSIYFNYLFFINKIRLNKTIGFIDIGNSRTFNKKIINKKVFIEELVGENITDFKIHGFNR